VGSSGRYHKWYQSLLPQSVTLYYLNLKVKSRRVSERSTPLKMIPKNRTTDTVLR